MLKRRSFLELTAGTGVLAGFGDWGFLSRLAAVPAAETRLEPQRVQLRPEIEPLVRLLENTPRDRLLEEVAARIQRGLTYRDVLTALLLAGVRNIQPRPVGFKFHAVLVVNSAHLASLSSPATDRWLPIFWALDYFKSSQEADRREGDWTLAPIDESVVPPAHRAKAAFTEAMDRWDEPAADAAIVGLVRTAGVQELFELFCRYGARDFRDIGHKQIYVANGFRALEVMGWQHAEPVLRSLAYALLDRSGDRVNPAEADLPADRPFRHNQERVGQIRADWLAGKPDTEGTATMLRSVREGDPDDAATMVLGLLKRGVSPQSLFEAYFNGAAELLMRAPGIIPLHAVTFTNALHYGWQRCRDEDTRKLLLLQNASFLPLFRRSPAGDGLCIDRLDPIPTRSSGAEAVEEIFAELSQDRLTAARKTLAYLATTSDTTAFAAAARRLIFLKGNNSHDYKYSSAVLEDYALLASPWRERFLAASVFNLRGAADPDNDLVQRTRAALS